MVSCQENVLKLEFMDNISRVKVNEKIQNRNLKMSESNIHATANGMRKGRGK